MTDSIADRTYRSALMMWETCGGKKPERANFDHLNLAPATVPDLAPATPAPSGTDATPVPPDKATADAVKSVLAQMRAANNHRGSGPDGGSAA